MSKEEIFEVKGTVIEVCRNGLCKVEILDNVFINTDEIPQKRIIQAIISGKIRNYKIKILKGDSVTVQMSLYDNEKGRITFREKSNKIQKFDTQNSNENIQK